MTGTPTSGEDTEREQRAPSGTTVCAVHNITYAVWLGCVSCDPDEEASCDIC